MSVPGIADADRPVIAAYALVHGLSVADACDDWLLFPEAHRDKWRGACGAYADAEVKRLTAAVSAKAAGWDDRAQEAEWMAKTAENPADLAAREAEGRAWRLAAVEARMITGEKPPERERDGLKIKEGYL